MEWERTKFYLQTGVKSHYTDLQAAWAHNQAASGDPQGGEPTAFGQPMMVLHHSTVQNCFLVFRGSLCVTVCLLYWHWAPLRRAWLHLLCIFCLGIYRHWWDSPHWRGAPVPDHLGYASLDPFHYIRVSPILETQSWTHCSSLTGAVYRGRITSLDLLAILCLMQLRIPLAFLAARAHCLLMSRVVSPPLCPHVLCCRAAFQLGGPSMSWCLCLFLPRCRTLLNFVRFLSAHCSRCIVIERLTDTESGVLPLKKVCLDLPALHLLQKLLLKVTAILFYSLFLIMLNLTVFSFLLSVTLLSWVHKTSEHDIPWFPFLLAQIGQVFIQCRHLRPHLLQYGMGGKDKKEQVAIAQEIASVTRMIKYSSFPNCSISIPQQSIIFAWKFLF